MVRFEVIPAIASASPKNEAYAQDRAAIVRVAKSPRGACVVVCDGVGAYEGSGDVAQRVSALASNHIRGRGLTQGVPTLAREIAEALVDDGLGATTLLALAGDERGEVAHCLVGNGMVIEIEAVFVGEGAVQLRWVDLALPHVSYAHGRPLLRSYLPCADPCEPK